FDDIDKGYKEHTERMKDGAKRFWSALASGEGAAVKAFKEAWDNVEIDLSAPSARAPGTPLALPGGGVGGTPSESYEEQSQAELQALRGQLEARLQMLREFTATEQELEIFRHESRLEDLRELWEGGIIP